MLCSSSIVLNDANHELSKYMKIQLNLNSATNYSTKFLHFLKNVLLRLATKAGPDPTYSLVKHLYSLFSVYSLIELEVR